MIKRKPTRPECIITLVMVLITTIPYLYAWHIAGRERFFTGFLYNVMDGNSYIAKMLLGKSGQWLFTIFYTPESHREAPVFIFHILTGKVAGALDVPLIPFYHILRVLCALALAASIWAFMARLASDLRVRRVAFLLVMLGGGSGWLLLLLGKERVMGSIPLEFWLPEAYAFHLCLSFPHIALAEALLLVGVMAWFRALRDGSFPAALAAGAAALGTVSIVPMYFAVLATLWVISSILIARGYPPGAERRHNWGTIRHRVRWFELRNWLMLSGITLGPSGVYLAYLAHIFYSDPVLRTWASQNRLPSPHILVYFLGYLFLIPPALMGIKRVWCRLDNFQKLALSWATVWLLLVYTPVNPQRRLLVGAQVPLAWLAAEGMVPWLKRRPLRYIAWGWMVGACLSSFLFVGMLVGWAAEGSYPSFRTLAEVKAADYLARVAYPGDRVLCSLQMGNFIPTRAPVRVFIGHSPETAHFHFKAQMVRRFFSSSTSDRWREQLLREYNIRWVVYGPWERRLGDWSPHKAPYLKLMAEVDGIEIYRLSGKAI